MPIFSQILYKMAQKFTLNINFKNFPFFWEIHIFALFKKGNSQDQSLLHGFDAPCITVQ